MESSPLPEWQQALLERKRAKRAAEAARLPSAPASLSRLLELYSAMPGVRTIRADRIVIIETRPGEATQRRVPGAAELRAEQVVVYEPEAGRVRRLRHQFEPGRGGGATRMRRGGGAGRKEASEGLLRMRDGGRREASRKPGGRQDASGDELRMSERQECAQRLREGQRDASLRPGVSSLHTAHVRAGAPLRMSVRQSNASPGMPEWAKEASSGALRMLGGQLAASPPRSQYVQKIAANSFVVNPRGRRAIDPKEPAADPREGGWLATEGSAVPKEGAWAASPDTTVPKENSWPPSPDTTVPKEGAWPASPDITIPKEGAWPASPDARVPGESTWAASKQRATNPKDAGGCRRADIEESPPPALEPYYGSLSPKGCDPYATNPEETPSLRDATDPRGRGQGAVAARAVAALGAGSLRRNSQNSFQVVPRRASRWPPDRVPVTCIDEDATGPLAPLKVLSPRLEGCDVSYDGPGSKGAAWGPGFESTLPQNGSWEAPSPELEGAVLRGRYPRADEIEVIGGYLSLDRSCMSKGGARRRKKMKISFDDTRLHTMFEYPSENSLAAEEWEEEVEGGEEEEEYASEVDEAPPPRSAKRAAPFGRTNSGFTSYTPNSASGLKEAPPKLGTVAPPDNHLMLTPASTGALSDFSSEPALYF